MIRINGLRDILDSLDAADLVPAQRAALGQQANALAAAAREMVSRSPGGDHTAPWQRTGNLRDSIGAQLDDAEAVVGSDSNVAVYQEFGTATVPARPFLAATGARLAKEAADEVARAVYVALKEVLG